MKRRVGLYLGVNSIGGVVVENKKVVSLAKFDLSSLEDEAKAESLNGEVRWEVLINRTLRHMKVAAEEKNIYLSLADKDFIFRSFEMPLMSKKEIESSLIYEIEQHIPFKAKELVWDYSFIRSPKHKKIDISFLGLTQSNFKKYEQLLNQLGLIPLVIEPASLSLVRVVKSKESLSRLNNYILLDFSEFEGYLTFYHCNLPAFNRYLTIPRNGKDIEYDKFVDIVRFSFQYFKREFKNYQINKLILVNNDLDQNFTSLLKEELQIEIVSLRPSDLVSKENITVECVKALGVAARDYYSYRFKPTLKSTQEQIKLKEARATAPFKTGLLVSLAGFGLLFSIFIAVFFGNKVAMKKIQYERREEALSLPQFLKGLSSEELKAKISKRRSEVNFLKTLISPADKISFFLERIPSLLPQGLWLDTLKLTLKEKKYRGTLKGYIFLDDSYKERSGIDKFIGNLRKDKAIKNIFSYIEMVSSERRPVEGIQLTSFDIRLEGYED